MTPSASIPFPLEGLLPDVFITMVGALPAVSEREQANQVLPGLGLEC